MPWLSQHTSHCRGCGRKRDEDETFSRRGKCEECGEGAMIENHRQLKAHTGPRFLHWRRQSVAALGGVLVDELEVEE